MSEQNPPNHPGAQAPTQLMLQSIPTDDNELQMLIQKIKKGGTSARRGRSK